MKGTFENRPDCQPQVYIALAIIASEDIDIIIDQSIPKIRVLR